VLWLQDVDDLLQVGIAGGLQGHTFRLRQFVRSEVATAFIHEYQRTVVDDEVGGKEVFRRTELITEESPEPASAHFAARAVKASHRTFGMLPRWLAHRSTDPQPVAHGSHLSEWHAGLGHAEGSRIHAHENHALTT